LDDGEHTGVQRGSKASTRIVVEAAIDFSNGANREMWKNYRWRMSDDISPWRMGGLIDEEQATSEFNTGAVQHEPWESEFNTGEFNTGEFNTRSERHEHWQGPGAMEESGSNGDD
jgi:hypothetical protein